MALVDAVVVGGSFAGLQSAMVLGRQLYSVVVFDTELPRNRFANGMHNVFALDGKKPGEAISTMREQTLAYPRVSYHKAQVTQVQSLGEVEGEPAFQVTAQGKEDTKDCTEPIVVKCKRVILAYGVTDALPPVPDIWDFWGVGIAHCPHCHGYEVNGKQLAILKNAPMPAIVMQVSLAKELSPSKSVLVFTNGETLKEEEKKLLRGAAILESPILKIVGDKSTRTINSVQLADGSSVSVDCIFVMPQTTPSGDLHKQLGLNLEQGMTGPYIACDAQRATNVKGVYVAGDCGNAMHQVNFAVSSGSMAGMQVHAASIMASNARNASL